MNENEKFEERTLTQESPYYLKKRERKERRAQRRKFIATALICAILGGVIGGVFVMNFLPKTNQSVATDTSTPINIETTGSEGIVEAVAKKALPSVVGITTQTVKIDGFWGPVQMTGAGSGFIVNKEGYIVTNAHVVDGGNAKEVSVLFHDGDQSEAQVLWADPSLDLAIIRVKGQKNLVPAELGDSSKLNIGEPAIAIGNPLGLDFQRSVTSGVISGLDRTIGEVKSEGQSQGNYMDGLIQTDASINRGNSGGPLLNKKGEVIGINTVKISTAEGLGFSIPINTVKPIVEQVIETGNYQTVSLGIRGKDLAAVTQTFNVDLGTDHGVVVYEILPGSSVAASDIEPGDVIVKVDDKDISGMGALKKVLYDYKEGDTAEFTIVRKGKTIKTNVTFKDVIRSQ
ncbi:MAG: trypsin-like peptidase domain-containing protein [Tissierellia bacterium]|nr:trypsin-like peptidase domain-containing protein [Tissierellia bacterium]